VTSEAKRRGFDPLKVVFVLAYVMQGVANPFQGITTLPFKQHLEQAHGLSAGATQDLFAKSYLAWSFKPLLGFAIDAYGRTRTLLIGLLAIAALGYLATPLLDTGAMAFFATMFAVSVVMAGSDVAVDRATVIAGDDEAKATGKSRATTVGLNQAICWLAVYGTSFVAALLGGYITDHVPFRTLILALAAVPLLVLLGVLRLPRDSTTPIPLTRSIARFWTGLNTGTVLAVVPFYFLFFFQPQAGLLFYDYQAHTLHFTQTQIGVGIAAGMVGYFVGVLLFMWKGVRWQERYGMRTLFRRYIVAGAVFSLTQYLLLDPWFSGITGALSRALPVVSPGIARIGFLCLNTALLTAATSMFAMSTYSLVGAVIPPLAAGSLFAGFMSVTNLAYSASYASGGWLYDHGMGIAPLRGLQRALFGIGGGPADKLSMSMLVLIGSAAYFASFIAVHLLPDRAATLASDGGSAAGPERWLVLPAALRRACNWGALAIGAGVLAWLVFRWKLDPVSSVMMTFLGICLVRRTVLDVLLRRVPARAE
jgi:MFS family permease